MADNNTYNCDLCGGVVVGSRHCAVCPTNKPILQRVAATYYPTVFDERAKTNGQN